MKKVLKNYYLNKHQENRFKTNSRIDKSFTTTEEVINMNTPPHQCNKTKNHCILNIWKY